MKFKLPKALKIVIPLFRNYYFSTAFFLLIWMLFFDGNDFISQYRLTAKKNNLEEEKEYYLRQIEKVKKEREEIFGSDELIEKYARERYLMKKPNEDIYIIKR
jgi:cell division protein FtsB